MARLGESVDSQRPLAMIHANDEESWQQAADAVRTAMVLGDQAPAETPVVYKRITE